MSSGEVPGERRHARSQRCPSKLGGKAAALEAFRRPELTDDGGGVLVLSVDGEVEAADVGGGEFAGKIGEGSAKLGESVEGGLADDGDGIIRGKVVAIVFESDEAERVDEAVGGVARDDVDLVVD